MSILLTKSFEFKYDTCILYLGTRSQTDCNEKAISTKKSYYSVCDFADSPLF